MNQPPSTLIGAVSTYTKSLCTLSILSYSLIWGNEGGENHYPCVCKQLGNFPNTPDVLFPIFRGKPEVLVQP